MTFVVPIVIEEQAGPAGAPVYSAHPVFAPEPRESGERLSRVLNRLTSALHRHLLELSRLPRHDELAAWVRSPVLEEATLELRLELGSGQGSHLRRFFLVGRPALGRKLWFAPALPALTFEVLPGQDLAERAGRVFTRHFRDAAKSGEATELETAALRGKARLATVEVSLDPAVNVRKPKASRLASLFGGTGDDEKPDGQSELRKTGQRLNDLFPDDLDRAVGRETEVGELLRLLAAADRRPVLLMGPRKAGKTAILHEAVRRMEKARVERRTAGERSPEVRAVWQVSPMRLISGMSVVGEWENRVVAILDHAAARDAALYFDDLPGLFTAGVSSASDLNVAAVLKPAMERRRVRVVAEITPEAWRVLRERDRSLADLFHVLPVGETGLEDTWRVLLTFTRELEARHRVRFAADAVPTAVDLHRRFVRDAAFPGKAAGFLRRLASRSADADVGRAEVFEAFREQSGMRLALLDAGSSLARPDILEELAGEVAGQPAVLEAFADTVSVLKARLNDPGRPLATMLLLGPTGVGKTQSAKALAKFLFGDAGRLVRFDMNEFLDGAAVLRLVGTPFAPEGLLTGALRRQPFCVVLLDEIEKAAPEVFDLLLGVLDEGRLTDALGRVADFTNAVILLTSNLGAREARSRLGFGAAGVDESEAYRTAAEKFFRPEFYNRLDRVIPFRSLGPDDLSKIAEGLIEGLFQREGLRQRDCLLQVTPRATAEIVRIGHHPQLGARALKRAIERELAQPLAERLAVLPPATPTRVDFDHGGAGFELSLSPLVPAVRAACWVDWVPAWSARESAGGIRSADVLDRVRAALDRLEERIDSMAPAGRLELGHVPAEREHAIYCREQLRLVDGLLEAAGQWMRGGSKPPPRVLNAARARGLKLRLERSWYVGDPRPDAQRAAESLQFELRDLQDTSAEADDIPDSPLAATLREAALLELMVQSPAGEPSVALVLRSTSNQSFMPLLRVAHVYRDALEPGWGCRVTPLWPLGKNTMESFMALLDGDQPERNYHGLLVQGPAVRALLGTQLGLHLHRYDSGGLNLVQASLLEVSSTDEARARLRALPDVESDAGASTRIVRYGHEGRGFTDYPSGLRLPADPSAAEWRAALLSALPLPPEITSGLTHATRPPT